MGRLILDVDSLVFSGEADADDADQKMREIINCLRNLAESDGKTWRARLARRIATEVAGQLNAARPLVVIDPEDRKQVERFVEHLRPLANDGTVSGVQQALREFANPTPPKPAEPIGLGAVVEDAEDGSIWSRRSDGRWHCLTGDPNVEDLVEWRHFATARVLSEGVTA